MPGRDWRTIGATGPRDRAPLPPWIWWAIPPLGAPLAVMAWIAVRWDRIPLNYATHYGPPDRSHGWQTRTPLHVYGPLIFAAGLVALILAMALLTWYGSPRSGRRASMGSILVGVTYVFSLIFTCLGLVPATHIPPWTLAMFVPLAALGLLIYVVQKQSEQDEPPDDTPAECWRLGAIYHNPADPALFVRARQGVGYTLNMGNRLSYVFLIGLLAGIAALATFLVWSQS